MNQSNFQLINLKKINSFVQIHARLLIVFAAFALIVAFVLYNLSGVSAQTPLLKVQTLPPTPFHIGEKLTYNISFASFNNAAYAETYVVSRGKLGEKDAVELRSKIKTSDIVSAFYLIDESRVTYAASDSGLPLYIRKTSSTEVTPKETVSNFMVNPTAYNDLLTVIYQARNAGGSGSFSFQEDDKIYNAIFVNTGKSEKVKNVAGEFDTSLSTVESTFLAEKGIKNLSVNFSSDEARIPVLIRFKTAKGVFRAEIASVLLPEPETVTATPTPTPVQIQRPTPRPIATPTPFVENLPLSKELPFALGETLEYQVTNSGQLVGLVTLQAKERKQLSGQDSLLLTARVTETQPNQVLFKLNDSIRANVNPDSLAPQQIEITLNGALAAFNQQILFDQKIGAAMSNKGNQMEIPVGTHSILSLAYAIRSFNLKPSLDRTNPVNDTRVAVFLDSKAYVFSLRPANSNILNLRGETVSAQLISITTGDPAIDQYNLRVWLSTDEKRLPLRLAFGTYQADLVSEKQNPPK